jgi:D-alanyl-D-alanine carboxypeptidase/D-alanyl-D-alanine-endopeptidase (penicillin-binding protein 4)
MRNFLKGLIATLAALGLVLATGIPTQAADCTPITKQLASKKLGKLYAYAVNLNTDKVLVNVRSNSQTPSASVMKTITAAAALKFIVKPREAAALEPYRATTSVLTMPSEPSTIILRGGGDPTLSRVEAGSYTTYYLPGQHPVKLRELAARTLRSIPEGTTINKLILDSTFFKGPVWNPNWFTYTRNAGYMTPITGLMVDAGRVNPDLTDRKYSGRRVLDPATQAGRSFKSWLVSIDQKAAADALALGAVYVSKVDPNMVITKAVTPNSALELVSGQSQPITNWIRHFMKISDNTETEMVARHTAMALGLPNKYTSVQTVGTRLFQSIGVNSSKLVMKDGSGLAHTNRVTPRLLVGLLENAAEPDSDLAALTGMMATSGEGTLSGRFMAYNKTTKRNVLVIPRGSVRAKTGYIGGLYSLSGIVTTQDNQQIAFAIFARSDRASRKYVGAGTKSAIDNIVEKLYLCGSTL